MGFDYVPHAFVFISLIDKIFAMSQMIGKVRGANIVGISYLILMTLHTNTFYKKKTLRKLFPIHTSCEKDFYSPTKCTLVTEDKAWLFQSFYAQCLHA